MNMAEEVKNPARVFPPAMLLGMGAAGLIYVLVAITSSLLVPAPRLAALQSGALLEVVRVGAPGFPLGVFAVIGLFAVINSVLINMLMTSRLVYGLSRERIVPRLLGSVHPLRQTPWVSILFTSAIAVALVGFVPLSHLGAVARRAALRVSGHPAVRPQPRALPARRCAAADRGIAVAGQPADRAQGRLRPGAAVPGVTRISTRCDVPHC